MSSTRKIKKDGILVKTIEEVLYIFFVIAGFYSAFLIKFNMRPSAYNITPFFDSIPYIILTSLIIFHTYDIVSTLKKTIFENMIIIGLSLSLIDIITVAIVFFMRGFAFPRSVFLIGFVIQFIFVFITKVMILTILRRQKQQEGILIIALEEEATHIANKILDDKFNYDQIRYISNEINKNTYALIEKVSKVYIGSSINNDDKADIIQYCSANQKIIYLVPSLFEIALVDFKVMQMSDMLVFKIEDLGLSYEERLVKRLIDIIISLIGIIIVSPIMLVMAVIIKLHDKGPVLLKQERVTENNKTFCLYKFRTMIVDAEKDTGPILAKDQDPRITPVGKFLRILRIDELPQLFNVLKGDMSIVGPRPERPFFVEQYNEEIEGFKYRTFVKAGITGLAQVLGKYATEPKDKAKYDLFYIKNYSLILDIKIIFNTIKIMCMKENSTGIIEDKARSDLFKELNL